MQFRGEWRDYQAQVLGEMADRFTDGRLHVVAAPGAGKTVLGLEIVRRLGRRAVVFAPTVAIRDQWIQRLVPLFLDVTPGPDEISDDLTACRQLTVATYQALNGFRRSDGLEALIAELNAGDPVTLVLDEAHHLRREWWNSLEQMARSLRDVRILALTATPPYDSSFLEWTRYEALCGPIDLEIGTPELVRNGDLCPHQDHVILSRPGEDGLALLDSRRRALLALQVDLLADDGLLDALEAHPWVSAPDDHVEAILDAPEMLSSVLVLLAAAGRRLPRAPLKLLGVTKRGVPQLSFLWLETLLDGITGRHAATFALDGDRVRTLRERLHRLGVIEGGRVRLQHSRSIFRLMTASLSKLASIAQIAAAEHASLGDGLRMVILSDHIRSDELPSAPQAPFRPTKMGVVPIFEHMRRAGVAADRLGVLTGTLVIVPRAALRALDAMAVGMDLRGLRIIDLPASPDHVRIEPSVGSGVRLVQLVTALFTQGEIQILVGTQALLGEGWDAPALNSLVLASNTASFMLSNQMRGRGIRLDPSNPGKVANIWHLATIPHTDGLLAEALGALNWGHLWDEPKDTLSDAMLLARRFRAFEGVSNGASTLIESGIGRLGVGHEESVEAANARTLALAADRPATAARWAASLGDGGARARVRETAAPAYAPRILAWTDTLHALTWSAASGAVVAAGEELTGYDAIDAQNVGMVLMALGGAALLAAVPRVLKAARLIWRNGSVEGSLGQVGQVVLESLADAKLVDTADLATGRFEVRTSIDGRKDVVLLGVSRATERQVMQAIAEVLGPVENPRYLLMRESDLFGHGRVDYHAVPAALGARRAWAERFAQLWSRRVGSSRLVFARTPDGRRTLLRARAKSLAAGLQRLVDRRSAWL